MSFTHNQNPVKAHKRIPLQERRRRLIQLVREQPGWNQQELADSLGVDKSTVCRDLKIINEEFKVVNSEMWILSRERVLKEIRDNKAECMRRLDLCTRAHQGSRWMEEWTKLNLQESKILGINSPSHIMINQEMTIRKEEVDAGVNAALSQHEESAIEIGPDGVIKIPAKEEINDRRSA